MYNKKTKTTMKKILMTLAAGRLVLTIAFCCAMISTVFTACSSDDDESVSDYAGYTVNPQDQIRGNCLAICTKMREALKEGMPLGNNVCKRDDAKAIRICDEIYNSTPATAHFKIVLVVTPLGNGVNNTSTTIKTYEY